MMLLTVYLAWSLTTSPCAVVKHYQLQGYSDAQIEDGARSRGTPERVIAWAKRNCKRA